MKWLVWALVAINLGLFAYFNLDHILPSAPIAKATEINPEKIKVLSQKEIEALPKKAVEAPPAAKAAPQADTAAPVNTATPAPAVSACFEWGVFSASNLASAQSAVAKLNLQTTVKEQNTQQASRFWVYEPPLKTAAAAQAKAAELKALGIGELFVVQEPKWKNAISFGIFEDEQLATKLLNELRAKGVKDAVKTLRNQGRGHSSLRFNNLAVNQIVSLKQLKSEFPEAALKEVACN